MLTRRQRDPLDHLLADRPTPPGASEPLARPTDESPANRRDLSATRRIRPPLVASPPDPARGLRSLVTGAVTIALLPMYTKRLEPRGSYASHKPRVRYGVQLANPGDDLGNQSVITRSVRDLDERRTGRASSEHRIDDSKPAPNPQSLPTDRHQSVRHEAGRRHEWHDGRRGRWHGCDGRSSGCVRPKSLRSE